MDDLHKEKVDKFTNRTVLKQCSEKTPIEDFPILFRLGSGSCPPDKKCHMQTSDLVLWCKFLDSEWFRPYGGFCQKQIIDMLLICSNDTQRVRLMELIAATNE